MSLRDRTRQSIINTLPAVLVMAFMLGLWMWVSYFELSDNQRFLLPPPQDVLRIGILQWSNFAEILIALWATTKVALVGLGVSILIGVVTAICMVQARSLERAIYPYAVFLQTVPILAIVPVIGFWFGFNFQSRVIVCVLFSLFPIITNTLYGLKEISASQNDLFILHGANRWVRLTKLQLPAAMPSIFNGFRISSGLSVIGAIVGDFFFRQGEIGIGRLIDLYAQRLMTEQLFTAVLVSSLLGLVVFWLFGIGGNLATRHWRAS